MVKQEKPYEIDLSSAIVLCSVIVAVTLFCSSILKNMPMYYGKEILPTLTALPWVMATTFFAALCFTTSLAMIGKSVIILSNQSDTAWNIFPSTMFRFSVYLLIVWFIFWGVPFAASMVTFISIHTLLGYWFSIPLTILVMVVSMTLIVKLFPNKFLTHFKDIGIIKNLGRFPAVLIIIGCFMFGFGFTNTCYTFKITGHESTYQQSETLELKVTVKGLITLQRNLGCI